MLRQTPISPVSNVSLGIMLTANCLRCKAASAIGLAPCAFKLRYVLLCLFVLVSASGCAYFQRELTSAELAERLQYRPDQPLEELVTIALAEGYRAVNGEGRARQVLELSRSDSGTIHRQFFEVQARGAGISSVFFLENKGSVDKTGFHRFPAHLRKEINNFLVALPEARRHRYKPLLVRQEKLLRQMVVYEVGAGSIPVEFSNRVSELEISVLYGLFRMPAGPFIFFGKNSREPSRRDLLEADDHFEDMVQEFLEVFRPKSAV